MLNILVKLSVEPDYFGCGTSKDDIKKLSVELRGIVESRVKARFPEANVTVKLIPGIKGQGIRVEGAADKDEEIDIQGDVELIVEETHKEVLDMKGEICSTRY